jgi:hypothetical protein
MPVPDLTEHEVHVGLLPDSTREGIVLRRTPREVTGIYRAFRIVVYFAKALYRDEYDPYTKSVI